MIDRRQFARLLAATPAALATSGCAGLGAGPSSVVDLSPLVELERDRADIPALGAAVVGPDGLLALGVAGVRVHPHGPPVSNHDRWHIGSCTKAITATLAARLIERGLLGWESTIGQVLGPDVHVGWHDVPLLWLLSHRSGAEGNFHQSFWEEVVARGGPLRDQRAWLVAQGLKTPPPFEPNTRTSYSNAGFVVAGAMLERAADLDWESLVRREVFQPLGMKDAGFGAPGSPGKLDQPLGHVRGETERWRPIPLGRGDDNPAAGGPAATIHLSLTDWSRFVGAHLRGQNHGDYLRAESWARLHTPGEIGWDYAPGWIVTRDDSGEPVLRHLGSNTFFVAQAVLYPARRRAVLLVTNLGDDAAEPAFTRLLEHLTNLPAAALSA